MFHEALSHGTHLNQGLLSPSWTPLPFPPYGSQPKSSSHAHPTMYHPPYSMSYLGVWPRYGFGYSPHGVLSYGMPLPKPPSMPPFGTMTSMALPLISPTHQATTLPATPLLGPIVVMRLEKLKS